MSLKVKLLKWAVDTFGELDPNDVINVREDILNTDKEDEIQQKVVLHVKKRIGVDMNWLEKTTLDNWEGYLKEMAGEHIAFDIKTNEGRELSKVSGKIKEEYKSMPAIKIYNYEFNLIIIKRLKMREKSHVGIKPRIEKG